MSIEAQGGQSDVLLLCEMGVFQDAAILTGMTSGRACFASQVFDQFEGGFKHQCPPNNHDFNDPPIESKKTHQKPSLQNRKGFWKDAFFSPGFSIISVCSHGRPVDFPG